MVKTKKRRRLKKKRRSNPKNPRERRGTLKDIVARDGPVVAMRELENLAKAHPDLATDIWEDAKWVVRNPFPRRSNPRKLISGDPAIGEMLNEDEPVRSFPRRARNPLSKRRVRRSRLRRNPDFDWGPKIFDPFKDRHPFGKRPTTTRINPTTGLRRGRRSRTRKNPGRFRSRRANPAGIFTSIYARNRRKRKNRKTRWKQ